MKPACRPAGSFLLRWQSDSFFRVCDFLLLYLVEKDIYSG